MKATLSLMYDRSGARNYCCWQRTPAQHIAVNGVGSHGLCAGPGFSWSPG